MSTRDPNRFNFSEQGSAVGISIDVGPPGNNGLKGDKGDKGDPGDIGPAGPAGPVNPGFPFNQNSASTFWVIQHNLSKKPTVVIVDGNGRTVRGSVTYPDDNQITISFAVPISGQAYLN